MKRYSTLIAILLLIAMLFSACGKSEEKKEPTVPVTPGEETLSKCFAKADSLADIIDILEYLH